MDQARITGGFAVAVGAIVLLAETVRAPSIHLDMAPLYAAALLASEGRLEEAYEVDRDVRKRAGPAMTQVLRSHSYPLRHCLRYLHPPVLAIMAYPLTLVDYPYAAYIFRTFSLLALLYSAIFLARRLEIGEKKAGLILPLLLLFDPVRMTLELGQTNLFVLALLFVGLSCKRAWLRGIPIGFAAFFKTFVLLVPLALLVTGRDGKRTGLAAFATWSLGNAFAYLLFPEATFAYLDMMRDLSKEQFLWPEQQSFASQVARVVAGFTPEDVSAFIERVVEAGPASKIAFLFAGLVAIGLLFWVFINRLDLEATMALAIPNGLLASPVLHSHYGVVLLVSLVWLLRSSNNLALGVALSGLALQALPLHSDEARAFVPLLKDLGIHWFFVTYRLLGVALVCLAMFIATRGKHG